MEGLVWLALAEGSRYLFWLIWGGLASSGGFGIFPRTKNAHPLNFNFFL